MEPIRLNKFLSEAGICSRRVADQYIQTGKVTVDGVKATPGMKVTEDQEIKLGKKVVAGKNRKVVLLVNKPVGVVCTEDKKTKNNIIKFLKYPNRVTYAGRLDKDSQGLLVMTNDGNLINQMMRARNHHEKEYKVMVDQEIDEEFVQKMSQGVHIQKVEDGEVIMDEVTRPCKVEKIGKYTFTIILTQGLNRQIRRMCEALGYKVTRLTRTRIMNLELGNIKIGEYREATKEELEELQLLLIANSSEEKITPYTKDLRSPIYKGRGNKGGNDDRKIKRK